MNQSQIELLAPAGSYEALIAAITNGADAVYLGGRAFGARHYASNFDDEKIKEAVKYAHARGVKIYVTVNTLVADSELEEAARYLNFLAQVGVDAVIVQDLGIVKLMHDLFPDFEMHASTQMTIHNTAGIEFLKSHGVSRVVLAREVGLDDIQAIRENTDTELEIFIHGALCISYSGQCLMSSMIGGRSGNRGKCAQPCRMKYQLVDLQGNEINTGNVGEHLLSPRDLSSVLYLPQIIDSGVVSLKLEGRMKRPEYVATVIRIYRQCLDRCLENPMEYQVKDEELRDLAQIFNRDFTPGYLLGNQGADLMSYKRPNNRGLFLGRITKVSPDGKTISLKLAEDLSVNDGIEIWVTKGGRQGLKVEKMWLGGKPVLSATTGQEVTVEITGKARNGDRIFKTHDAALMSMAQQSYKKVNEAAKTPLEILVQAREGEPLTIAVKDEKGNIVTAKTSFIAEKALKRPLTPEVVRQQLERLGNTPFTIGKLVCQIEGEIMVPLSELNNVRRTVIDKLEKARQPVFSRAVLSSKEITNYIKPQMDNRRHKIKTHELAVAVGEIESGLAAIEAGAQRIYLYTAPFRSQKVRASSMQQIISAAEKNNCELVTALPRLWHEHEIKRISKIIEQNEELGVDGYLVGNIGTLQLLRDLAVTRHIYADYPLNIFNHLAVELLESQQEVKCITLSPELTFEQIKKLPSLPDTQLECIIHGSLPLMLSEYCAVGALLGGKTAENPCSKPCLQGKYGLKDRLNLTFPLEMDENCRMHVYNSKELCLVEDLQKFGLAGVKSLRIEARKHSAKEVKNITTIYRHALTSLNSGYFGQEELKKMKEKLLSSSSTGFTKGHYFRGVL